VVYDAAMPGVLAVVQARMSSSRLPGKTLADVDGEPMLGLMLQRIRGATEVNGVVIATTEEPDDDPIEALGAAFGVDVFRGDREDVLSRVTQASNGHVGPIVRLTADCPLIDPQVIDRVVEAFREMPGCAYASNVEPRTFPDGLDVEVIAAATLSETAATAVTREDREHVTTALRRTLDRIPSATVYCEPDLGDLRWTVDTLDDLDFVRSVVVRLGDRRHSASMEDILGVVRTPPSLEAFGGARRA
jgi:spore coat polysaccharide biosynthesis protein SpsF